MQIYGWRRTHIHAAQMEQKISPYADLKEQKDSNHADPWEKKDSNYVDSWEQKDSAIQIQGNRRYP